MEPKFHWLIAALVITRNKQAIERQNHLNLMKTTENEYFSRMDMAKAQHALMERFVKECEQIPGFKIKDVFIQSINCLGVMTEEQFHRGFIEPVQTAEIVQ